MDTTQRPGSSPASQRDCRDSLPQPTSRPGVGLVQRQPQPQQPQPQQQPLKEKGMPISGRSAYQSSPPTYLREDDPVDTAVPDQHRETTANSATSSTAMTSRTLDIDVDKNPARLPPLISAVINGTLPEVTGLLAQAETDIDQVCEERGWSALMYAANEGQLDRVAALLDAGANVNFSGIANKETALMIAAFNNQPDVVRLLLHAGANVNTSVIASGDTALSLASAEGHIDVVRVLLSQPQVDLDNSHNSPLMIAARNGHVDIVELLLQQEEIGPAKIANSESALMLAAEHNHLDVVIRLVDALLRIYGYLRIGEAALVLASMNGHVEVVDFLLSRGVDANSTSGGNSALMVAAEHGQSSVVNRLMKGNADVNFSSSDFDSRDTALILAAQAGWLEVVELLITHINIELDKADNDGKSALMRAASSNQPAVVECLLDAGASTGRIGRAGNNALEHMLNTGYAAIIEVLLQKNVEIDHRVFNFFPQVATPFDTAVADLCAERTAVGFVLPKPEEAENFFKELIDTLGEDSTGQAMLKWLRHKGIRMACARQVLAALSGAHAPWKKEGASEQQKINYCLSALSKLRLLDGGGRLLAPYRLAKTSVAARTRLGKVADAQLKDLCALAIGTLDRFGVRMGDTLIACCMEGSRMHNKVNAVVLKASLLDQGYCEPVVNAIIQSWKATIKKLVLAASEPDDANIKNDAMSEQGVKKFKTYFRQHAPAKFARELLNQLNFNDLPTQLQSSLGEINDGVVEEQLQIQCKQLRQFCAVHPGSPTSTSSPSSPPKQ